MLWWNFVPRLEETKYTEKRIATQVYVSSHLEQRLKVLCDDQTWDGY